MKDLRFKYYSNYSDGSIATDICTLEEIEDGYFKKPFLSGVSAREQFTGIKERDGVDVFSGDIIDLPSYLKTKDHRYAKVVWEDSRIYLIALDNGTEYGSLYISLGTHAGNIHENTELLEEV